MDLFKLLGIIAVDNSEAKKALQETSNAAKDTADDLSNASSAGEKTSGKWGTAFKKVGKGALVLGKTVAVGLGAGATALGGLTAKALSAAGELEQNMGGSEAVFGQHADKIQAKAKEAFSNMGLSTSDYLATANKMGALFKGAGFETEEALDLSSNAMQRAADVASIMGIDTASAMEAVAGAAKGNFTMMDNLGVAMNDTTLNAYALEKGINKTTQEMTNQEKIALAMEMFMEKTSYAAGNYAKENETLAGSLGTAKAALSNFLSGAGSVEDVVSSFSGFADVVVKNINEMFPSLMNGITQLVNKLVPMIPPLLNQLLPGLIEGATSLINGIVSAMPAIVQALMGALPALIQGITQIVNALITALPSIMEALVSALPTLIPALIDGLISMIVTLCTMMPQIIQPIIDYMPEIIVSIVTALLNNLPALIGGFIKLFGGLTKAWMQIQSMLKDAISKVFKAVWEAIKKVFAPMGDWFSDKFTAAKDGVQKAWSSVKNFFANIKNGIVEAFSNVKEKLTAPFTKARDTIKTIADKIKGFFKGEISMPKIKLPHFSIKPSGWKIRDLLEGSIPKLGIDWYAKAMNNPMVMTQPTVFGYNSSTGQLMGGGENGSEVVSGTNTLMNMIQGAVAEQNNRLASYMQKLLEVLATYFPQIIEAMDRDVVLDTGETVGALVVPMNQALGKLSNRRERGR